MPEWPEMERYRTLLGERIAGARLQDVEVTREKSINMPVEQFKAELLGRSVWYVERRGKHLIFHLDNGKRLLLHLMLGGWLFYGSEEEKPERTVQITLTFPQGKLYFIGLRLGYLHLLSVRELDERLKDLGPEPFDSRLTQDRFRALFKGKRGVLKGALVDQKVIAGIGNCYADEIAFTAGVRPGARIPALTDETWSRLYAAMHAKLQQAVSLGGYMEDRFTTDDLLTGGYNDNCQVYDRGGEPCLRCGSEIVREEINSRKVFYCPSCQHEA